jgi:uncharacterized NAD-dependent epimerase/dehydratase family protein
MFTQERNNQIASLSKEANAMYYPQTAKLAIYAEGEFYKGRSKTAEGVIRYGKNPIACVIDSSEAGKTVGDVMGIKSDIPIVKSINDALKLQPEALLLGTAWSGGHLPDQWRADINLAIKSGLDIINGLHDFLSEDKEFSHLADNHKVRLIDVRRPPEDLTVASGLAAKVNAMTVLTVGTDCSVGKMTVSLELSAFASRKGHKSKFIATGQTGIMIDGVGMPVDRIIGDFMAGAVEEMVVAHGNDADFLFIEGQGSIIHPGFSGVTMAILHGSCPDALILCHKPSRKLIKDTEYTIPPLSYFIPVYEQMASALAQAKVVGIALNTSDLSEAEAKKAIAEAEKQTNLPANDPVRFGCENLFAAILQHKEKLS